MERNTLAMVHAFLRAHVQPGALCIDATAGRGRDTALLCRLAGPEGRVLAFDVQQCALDQTAALLEAEGLRAELHLDSHEHMSDYAAAGSVDCIVFNFGRLPGGDPAIMTRADSSVAAVSAALELLKPGSVMALALYYGGANGYEERDALLEYLCGVDSGKYSVLCCDWRNRPNDPPLPLLSGGRNDMAIWNPWHGCHKISPGCLNCYVYRRDESVGKDASVVTKTGDYDLPLKRDRHGEYKLRADGDAVFTCMTSDFFLKDADDWRPGCWDMIRERRDLHFFIITKRIDRFTECAPPDWGDGWEHVTICSTCENQDRADYRLPILLELPIRHRRVACEPMLGEINIEKYLATGRIESVVCGGESGPQARPCDFRWVQELRRECIRCGVDFWFKQTGAVFVKDGRTYHIDRKDQTRQANKSGYSYSPGTGTAAAIRYRLPERSALFELLGRSEFRSRFHLSDKDRVYIAEKGMETVRAHAQDIVAKRLAAENPENDGKQTPMKGHPVFLAQHATACCCRTCLEKWHRIPAGKALTTDEQAYIVDVLMDWIAREIQD